MDTRKTISASECSTWLGCSLRHRYKYRDRAEDETRGGALVLGSVVDTAVKAGVRLVRSGEATTDAIDSKHLVDAAWSAEEANTSTPILWGAKGRDAALGTAHGLVAAFFKDPAVRERIPHFVELDVKVEVPILDPVRGTDTGILLKGYIDAIEETKGTDGKSSTRVAEFKTSATKGAYDEAGLDQIPIQVVLYNYALRRLRGEVVASEVGYFVGIKTKTPEWTLPVVRVTPDAERRALLVVQHVARAIELGVAVPSPSWMCPTCPSLVRCSSWAQTEASAIRADPFAA